MSASGDLRDSLERLAEMMPLSEREIEIAQMMFKVSECAYDDVKNDAAWFGDDAVKAFSVLFADED